jgi:hypothetical protein
MATLNFIICGVHPVAAMTTAAMAARGSNLSERYRESIGYFPRTREDLRLTTWPGTTSIMFDNLMPAMGAKYTREDDSVKPLCLSCQ